MNDLYTVIIPEHNRPERLKRLLDYYKSYGCNIIVTDSSDVRFKYLDQYDDVFYAHYPKMHLAEKISNIFDQIRTPYVVMCADDDYIFPSIIEKIVSYLQAHDDYKSGQGIYARYFPLEKMAIYLDYPQMVNNSLEDEEPSSRILHLMSAYYQFYYAVFEKDLFISAINSTIIEGKCRLQNLCLLELYISMYAAASAKHMVFPELYCMREYIRNSAGSYIPNYATLLKNGQSIEEINFLKYTLSSKVSDDEIQGKSIIEIALSAYLNSSVINSRINIPKKIILKIDDIFLHNSLRKIWHKFLFWKLLNSYSEMCTNIRMVKENIYANFKSVYSEFTK